MSLQRAPWPFQPPTMLDELLIVTLILLLIYFCWKSTEVRDYPFSHQSIQNGPGAISVSGLHRTSSLGVQRDVAIVPLRGNFLNRLVDQITTGGSSLRHRRHHRLNQRAVGLQARLNPNPNNNNSVEEIEYNHGNILMTHVLSSWASNESFSTGTNTETEESRLSRQTEYLIDELENEAGPAAIIREMDRDLSDPNTTPSSAMDDNVNDPETTSGTEEVQNCTNENNENGNKQAVENTTNADQVDGGVVEDLSSPEDPWKIKIKYLNDDMKVVEAKPSQTLGEFKRRNFAKELHANKLVRLVFNGKVLQPEGASLRSCALFENCVVHCLVHNMPPGGQRTPQQQQPQQQMMSSSSVLTNRQAVIPYTRNELMNAQQPTGGGLVGGIAGGDNPQGEQDGQEDVQGEGQYSAMHLMRNRFQQWLLQQWNRLYNWRFFTELLLLAFTVTTIYLRVRYAELFTATATIGLILVSVMVLGISVTLNIL